MLPLKNKLNREAFTEVGMSGLRFVSPLFNGQVLRKPDTEVRFSVVVSKKIAKLAVERNRIKRKVYKALQILLPHVLDGVRVAFFVKKNLIQVTDKTLHKELEDLLRKMRSMR